MRRSFRRPEMPEATSTSETTALPIPLEIDGLRMTPQRSEVYRVVMEGRDHPTAHDVFVRSKERLPHISLATVYSCLEALVRHGVVRQVNFERESSRFCPNLEEHGHFCDCRTGEIRDVPFKPGVKLSDFLDLPEGVKITDVEINLRGELLRPS
jgi:Fur family peroxide stress response transcriptional regulator